MRLIWELDKEDVRKVKEFYNLHKEKNFVKNRIKKNVDNNAHKFSKDVFWDAMISCLLTTQQKSGPNSAVTNFISQTPFPLNYHVCKHSKNIEKFVEKKITDFGGIRRGKTIGEEVRHNYEWLKNDGWKKIEEIINILIDRKDQRTERISSEFIHKYLKGFGPKQSRNLLQSLGLTKYEIPIDSRIIKWLTDFGFPIQLSANMLSEKYYYNFALDGFQKLCSACKIYPCVLDAAIFSSTDPEWPEDRIIG